MKNDPLGVAEGGRRSVPIVVEIIGLGRFFTAVIDRGDYVECRTLEITRTFCSVQSTRPVTVMSYTLESSIDNLGIGDPSMVYIPPVDSYLTQYSLTSLSDYFPVYLSYNTPSLQELNTTGLLVNKSVFSPSDNFTTINCSADCITSMVCGRGTTGFLGQGSFDIQFSGDVPFWGYAYGFAREVSFAYPLPFEMRPIGCKFYKHAPTSLLSSSGLD